MSTLKKHFKRSDTNNSFKKKPDKQFNKKNHKKPTNPKVLERKANYNLKAGKLEDEEIAKLKEQYEKPIDIKAINFFKDFPLSRRTQIGLKDANFTTPTDIQKESIGYALQGKDILGAAITGSGKTLAFLIPVLETLFINKWTRTDGLGAIIISPTRELAYQIFETLKKIGVRHDFSAALIIGGKNLKFERKRMDQCNIIICTPGRLLQHMDENPLFNCDALKIVVLDEADRCLDMGFETTMNGIIENFPPTRQTLLFSATQTKSVKDLARLSLKDYVFVAPKSQIDVATPKNLQQNYVVIKLEDKITMLWSFIKNHLRQKIIVFVNCCKQVKFLVEMFVKLRSGTTVLGLYGTLHQDRRVSVYNEFIQKSNAVLICTDIASRGLDFPVVNWVIQLDCPEDVDAYIHRAGRTARHNAKGDSLLILLPSEEKIMVNDLTERNIKINQIFIDAKRLFSPRVKMEAYIAQNQELKATAQRAFLTYLKSIILMKNKELFNIDSLDIDAFAISLGLAVTPKVPFLEARKRFNKLGMNKTMESEEAEENDEINKEKDNQDDDYNSSSDDELFSVKQKDHDLNDDNDEVKPDNETPLEEIKSRKISKPLTKAALARRVVKKNILANRKTVFNEAGEEVLDPTKQFQSKLAQEYTADADGAGIDIEKAKELLRAEDEFDKQRFKQLVKAKHKEKKQKEKKKRKKEESESESEQEQDDFGSDEDDDDGYAPDLSWLPDPDKVYGSKGSDSDDESEVEQIHRPPTKLITKSTKKQNSKKESNVGPPAKKRSRKIVDNLTVNEAEMLAIKLLTGN